MPRRHRASDWFEAIFFEDNRLFARRAPRFLGILRKVANVLPHLLSFAFTNFASTYPRRQSTAVPQPLLPEENQCLELSRWPRHRGEHAMRGLPYADSVAARIDLNESLAGVDDLVFAMREVHRVCMPGALVNLRLVSPDAVALDPTLERPVLSGTIDFFTDRSTGPLREKAEHLSVSSLFAVETAHEDWMELRARKPEGKPSRPQRIDIGCGAQPREGYAGVDVLALEGVSFVRDVERHGLPFSDSTVSRVATLHFLEHVSDLVFVMNEIHRVCCADAIVDISVPTLLGPYAAADPTHVRLFNARTLSYFEASSEEYAGIQRGFEILEQHAGFSIEARLRVIK